MEGIWDVWARNRQSADEVVISKMLLICYDSGGQNESRG